MESNYRIDTYTDKETGESFLAFLKDDTPLHKITFDNDINIKPTKSAYYVRIMLYDQTSDTFITHNYFSNCLAFPGALYRYDNYNDVSNYNNIIKKTIMVKYYHNTKIPIQFDDITIHTQPDSKLEITYFDVFNSDELRKMNCNKDDKIIQLTKLYKPTEDSMIKIQILCCIKKINADVDTYTYIVIPEQIINISKLVSNYNSVKLIKRSIIASDNAKPNSINITDSTYNMDIEENKMCCIILNHILNFQMKS
jgi:hypothetical protein